MGLELWDDMSKYMLLKSWTLDCSSRPAARSPELAAWDRDTEPFQQMSAFLGPETSPKENRQSTHLCCPVCQILLWI